MIRWRSARIGGSGDAIAVFECGNPDRSAPALLLVHGLAHWSQAAWDRLAPLLDPQLRVVAFDLPGFGASDKPDIAYDADTFVAATQRVAEALLPERFALCGHSLGGAIAARYAAAHPDRIAHLTLIAPAGFFSRRIYRFLGSRIGALVLRVRPPERIVRRISRRAVVDADAIAAHEMTQSVAQTRDPLFRRAFSRVYRAALREFARGGQAQTLSRYSGPVLLAWGRQDRFVPIRALDVVRRVYPHAAVALFEHSAHLPMIEQPHQLAAAMNAGLTNRPSVLHQPGPQK